MEMRVQATESMPSPTGGPQATPQTGTVAAPLPAPGQSPPALSIAPWDSTGGMVAMGALIVGGVLVLASWLRQRRGATRPLAAGRGPASGTAKHAVRGEAGQPAQIEQSKAAAAELRALTEELVSILDTKSQHLETLIAQADQRLAQLERAARSATPSREQHPAPTRNQPPSPHAHIHALADEGMPIVEIARKTGKTTGTIELILNLRRSAIAAGK